ncbi:hypothetical protein HY638_01895 [Candidatus Woesearchaeota archaeon]|nr:hypothetical protein [Candidatus Woesearchaeota archaeon]
MAFKTITVTEGAYEAAKRLKHENESFSEFFTRLAAAPLKVKDIVGLANHTPSEAEDFKKRVGKLHEELGEGLDRRIKDVRSRLERPHRAH